MLERQIEVRHAGGTDGVDEIVAEVARVEIEQPRPRRAFGHGAYQRHDRTGAEFVGAIFAVARQVLGDEHDFLRPEFVDLTQNGVDIAAALRPAERGDGAESAGAVASFGDLHIGPRAGGARPRQVEQVECRNGRCVHRNAAFARRGDPERDRHTEARHLVDLGQCLGQFVAVALGHTTGHHQPRPVFALFVEGEDGVDRFTPRFVDECARVHHHQIGERRIVGGGHAVGEQRADELVAIDLVLRAAQSFDVELLPHGYEATRRTRRGPITPQLA